MAKCCSTVQNRFFTFRGGGAYNTMTEVQVKIVALKTLKTLKKIEDLIHKLN